MGKDIEVNIWYTKFDIKPEWQAEHKEEVEKIVGYPYNFDSFVKGEAGGASGGNPDLDGLVDSLGKMWSTDVLAENQSRTFHVTSRVPKQFKHYYYDDVLEGYSTRILNELELSEVNHLIDSLDHIELTKFKTAIINEVREGRTAYEETKDLRLMSLNY